MTRMRWGIMLAVLAGGLLAGCYTTQSGLPSHIKTVRVELFRNTTYYKGIETKLTARLIERLQNDPQIRVVNSGANATITGVIDNVSRTVTRETRDDKPARVQVVISIQFSFYDEVEQRYIIRNAELSSSASNVQAGLIDLDRGEAQADAEESAIDALTRDLVRQTVSVW